MNKQSLITIICSVGIGYILGYSTVSSQETVPAPSVPSTESLPTQPPTLKQEKVAYKDCPVDSEDKILPAPSLSAKLSTPLLSNHEGEVQVAWSQVPHASRYRVQVLDRDGKIVKNYLTSRSTLYLKELPYNESLPFTPYTVVLSTINRKNEEGALSPRYELRVRPLKNLTAPTINEITVEN